jgi:hypothetical protein
MGKLARHDLSTEIGGVGRKDEIGQMATAVQVFKDSMIEADRLKAEQEAAQRRAEARSAKMDELTRGFEESVGGVVQTVAAQAAQMESSAQSMSATAEETTKQASAVAAASEQSSANVQTVASATEELSSSIAEISRQVGHSNEDHRRMPSMTRPRRNEHCSADWSDASQKIGDDRGPHQRYRRPDQPARAQCDHRSCACRRRGQGLRGGRGGSEESRDPDLESHRGHQRSRSAADAGCDAERRTRPSSSIGRHHRRDRCRSPRPSRPPSKSKVRPRRRSRAMSRKTAKGTQDVSANIGGVTEAANGTGSAANQVLTAAQALTGQSGHLKDLVQQFLSGVKAA